MNLIDKIFGKILMEKFDENDYKGTMAIQNSIKNSIKGLVLTEPASFKDKKFGHWAITAMINLLVDLI